jgi:hypothetical protein
MHDSSLAVSVPREDLVEQLRREIVRTLAGSLDDGELATFTGLLAKLADGPRVRIDPLGEALPL